MNTPVRALHPDDVQTILTSLEVAETADDFLFSALVRPFEWVLGKDRRNCRPDDLTLPAEQYDAIYTAMCDRSMVIDRTGALHLALILEWANHGPRRAA